MLTAEVSALLAENRYDPATGILAFTQPEVDSFGKARGQTRTLNILFVLLVIVVAGTLIGDIVGVRQMVGKLWYWFGNQGWEYLQLGRFWQYVLVVALLVWTVFLVRAILPAWRDKKHREISTHFLLTAFAIPVFHLPALFFGGTTHFAVVDT